LRYSSIGIDRVAQSPNKAAGFINMRNNTASGTIFVNHAYKNVNPKTPLKIKKFNTKSDFGALETECSTI